MSNAYWRTRKQQEQFNFGHSLTQKIDGYIAVWENRCYEDGIPDEIPKALEATQRVPSYKAIAVSILKNDFNFQTLGFAQKESPILDEVIAMNRPHVDQKNRDFFKD